MSSIVSPKTNHLQTYNEVKTSIFKSTRTKDAINVCLNVFYAYISTYKRLRENKNQSRLKNQRTWDIF